MSQNNLDDFLKELEQSPLPGLPSSFQSGVWNKIQHTRPALQSPWQEKWEAGLNFLLRPAPVAFSLLLALLIGMGGALPDRKQPSPSLGLSAFDPKAADLNILEKP